MKVVKKLLKWYFRKAAESYAWMPSGMLPYNPN